MKVTGRIVFAMLAIAVAALTGGESSDDGDGGYWKTEESSSSSAASTSTADATASTTGTAESGAASSDSEADPTGAEDAVPFGALKWNYGHFNGSHAAKTSASIGGLRTTSTTLYYSWTGNTLSSWGLKDGDAVSLACFFVKRNDGMVVSSSMTGLRPAGLVK